MSAPQHGYHSQLSYYLMEPGNDEPNHPTKQEQHIDKTCLLLAVLRKLIAIFVFRNINIMNIHTFI